MRADAGLTQEQLADLAGLHVRTVRGIETGRISAPHRSTVEALTQALGLEVTARMRLLETWGLVVAGPLAPAEPAVPSALEQTGDDAVEDVVAAFVTRSAATLLPVAVTEQITIGPDRRSTSRRTEEVAVALVDGVAGRHLYFDPEGAVDPDHVHLSAVDNARVVRELRMPGGPAKVFELAFDRTLDKGDTHVLRYSVDLRPARTGGGVLPADGREIGGFLRSPASYLLEVRFAAGVMPRRVAQVFQAHPAGPVREVGRLRTGAGSAVHIALVNPKPGGHGIVWQW
jgi:transcriptional regulator with XRE-family HTH domain